MTRAPVGISRDRRDAYDEVVLVMHAPVWGKPRHFVKLHDEDAFTLEAIEMLREGRPIR